MSKIKTWNERCEEHPDHQTGMVSNSMIQARMQEEIDDLRAALAEPAQEPDSPERRCGGPGCDGTCCQPVQEPVAQALCEADRIMGHDDEATEWRERWKHLFGVAGSATSPWRESAAQGCSPGGTGMPAAPPQRPAEPVQEPFGYFRAEPFGWTDCAATDEGAIPLYTRPPAHQPLTVERLRDALVASRIVPPAAVEDPDGYDDGVTLHRIEALHRRLA